MDTSAINSSRKRKHAISNDVAASTSVVTAKITISDDNGKDALRPLMASCPAIALPANASLSFYTENGNVSAKSASNNDKGKGRASSMLQGECGPLDWHSSNRLFGVQSAGNLEQLDDVFGATGNEDGGCSASYALALYDPQKQSVSLISTPLHIMQHIPKRLKTLSALAASSDPVASNAAARTALGMEFGTKKAKRAILAVQRNKIDAGAQDLQEVQDVIMDTLDQGLTTLPQTSPTKLAGPGASSTIDIDAFVENARKTGMPVPDTDASKPHAVYAIHDTIILEKEWEIINPTYLIKGSKEDMAALLSKLPHYNSTWINDRVKHFLTSAEVQSKDRKKKLKYLLWLAALLSIKGVKGSIDVADDDSMRKRFGRAQTLVPLDYVRSLLERFGESARGTTKCAACSVDCLQR